MEGVFPYASLFFAVAIQATAYFFSNSLRNKASVLKVVALVVAICCSTYYSYIGIYNSVNSPARFLQEKYMQIAEELEGSYRVILEENVGYVLEAINDAASKVVASYTGLSEEKENMEACRAELSEEGDSVVTGMREPRQSDYANYEDYVTAYNAYVEGVSAGSKAEEEAARNGVLASYGFSSVEKLHESESENASSLSSLGAALGVTEEQGYISIPQTVSDISVRLSVVIDEAMMGQDLESTDNTKLNRLFQAAKLCGYQGASTSEVVNIIKNAAEATKEPLLTDYTMLVGSLEEGHVTAANTMNLKSIMDSEILTALLKINSLLPDKDQISYSDERYAITDLYLIPIQAFMEPASRMTAVFCLGVAALTDMLSVLFAISLRKRKPIWKRRTLMFSNQEDYMPQIYASLPQPYAPVQALSEFLTYFIPSPETESDGYMMCANINELENYRSLVALLCQINMAKLVPVGLLENEKEILLLKARFVFWANSIIYEEIHSKRKVSA